MAIFLDNLHYNGNLIDDLIVVTNHQHDFICVKTSDDSSSSYKFLVSHEESFEIGLLIK
jgi:glycine cleavage system aminomethyltransferase T